MRYAVAVRELCEFTAKAGDLDLRFTPSPSAQEGMQGHARMAARRAADYETEIMLRGECGALEVRGRADGYDSGSNRLEEFKTYRGDLARLPDNHRALHWAQLRIYGALICRQRALSDICLALVYFDVVTERETVLTEHHCATALEEYLGTQCTRFLAWAEQEMAHRIGRDAALSCLRFPYADFQRGQRELARAVYRGIRRGGALLAQAPTGIGKTIGTLFPALKAMPTQQLDKIFFLVAKTPGRHLALDVLARIGSTTAEFSLRVLELVARSKACEYPDNECHGAACPLARGFYDRLPAAREEGIRRQFLDQAAVREIALRHRICPYYLGQELTRWADVVVGDYNYYFDVSALLHGLTIGNQWKVAVLVDEAHNMIERARKMYSAELERSALDRARRGAPAAIRRSLAKVVRQWNGILDEQDESYRVYEVLPEKLLFSLQQAVAAISDYSSQQPTGLGRELLDFYFEAVHFCRLAAQFDANTVFDVTREPNRQASAVQCKVSALCLRNVIPRRFLAPRWAAAHATALFSATLSPPGYYRDVLGLPADAECKDVGSPFTADQLRLRIVRSISTRFRDRERSVEPIVALIASQFAARAGNYLAFFSSFDYLTQVWQRFALQHPGIGIWRQERCMSEPQRDAFLSRFTVDGQGVGFAVLGGAFAEGIDLPGSRLIGAFVATLGLPQLNAINEEMQRRMGATFGTGYEYTYLYPGLQKVVQAAGRVIRSPEDRGVVYLIDDRYGKYSVRRLLPKWWQLDEPVAAARAS